MSLRRALTESDLRPLPSRAADLLLSLDAPPRLAAHLRAVHDVAWQLADWFADRLPLDRAAVLFGAATHDIGKVVHVEELSGPGHQHEPAGRDLLLAHGIGRIWPASPPATPRGPRLASQPRNSS